MVVYLLNPTSNHNKSFRDKKPKMLYIFWILHQTTTHAQPWSFCVSCISFESYIKPQQNETYRGHYIVVYLLNPTSNHNRAPRRTKAKPLYIFWILHQTTTKIIHYYMLYRCISFESYIKPQPPISPDPKKLGCISFESYIKPQPTDDVDNLVRVVYLLNPTSNHNHWGIIFHSRLLYIFWILHQTTTAFRNSIFTAKLYIFWILHQTTTERNAIKKNTRCISFESYIKPQQSALQ